MNAYRLPKRQIPLPLQQRLNHIAQRRQTQRIRIPFSPATTAAQINEVQPRSPAIESVSKGCARRACALLYAVLVDVHGEEEVRVA